MGKNLHRDGWSRRDFIVTGVAGLAAAACNPRGSLSDGDSNAPTRVEKTNFMFRALGKTGITLPVVSMGSMNNPELIEAAFDQGVVHIDTSSAHARGNNERIIGRMVRNRSRDSFVIATSTGVDVFRDHRTELIRADADPDAVYESFEGSLARLGLDYVDIYYLAANWDRRTVMFEPFMKVLERVKKEGRTRFVGVTTHRNEPNVIHAAADSGFYDVVATAYNFRQQHRAQVREAIAHAAEAGLGVVAFKTQAGVYWDEERQHMINMRAALKWVLEDTNVHTAVPAFNTYEELREGLSVMNSLPLTPREREDLRLGDRMGWRGLYCQQCQRCRPQCPHRQDIPTLMRGHMYAVGYGDIDGARETLRAASISMTPCRDCRQCTVRCAAGFDVKSRVAALHHRLA